MGIDWTRVVDPGWLPSGSNILARSGSNILAQSGSGSTISYESGSNADPDPRQNLCRQTFFQVLKIKIKSSFVVSVFFTFQCRHIQTIAKIHFFFISFSLDPDSRSGFTKLLNFNRIRTHNPRFDYRY
jgi:hypothetical protein